MDEVREHLPAFLSAATSQQYDPAGDVRELLRLERQDLDRVVAIHTCLSPPVKKFVAGLRTGMRRPMTSSMRPIEVTQAVRGPIDWGATVRHRAMAGGDRTQFAARPARRVFDTPENQALAWLLTQVEKQLRRARAEDAADFDEEELSWNRELRQQRAELQRARRYPWLHDVQVRRPTNATLQRLRAARTSFYASAIPDAISTLSRLTEDPTEAQLTELLCQRYFRPNENWRLFEVAVALRLARAFAAQSPGKRWARLLVGAGGAPYARYSLLDGDEVRLHYQTWPASAGGSLHAAARKHHQLKAGPSRPDLVVERTGSNPDMAVLELKASRSGGYLGSGLSQLLGYLKERPTAWNQQPSGWLVAPPSDAYEAAEAGADDELWIVSADDVAEAAVARFAPLGAS